MRRFITSLLVVIALPVAANSLVNPGPVSGIARTKMSATPMGEWNRLSSGEGKKVEIWTLDGPLLNRVLFFADIAPGEPLFKERDKKREPLPKVSSNMLITDIPALLEATYRTRGDVNRMEIETQEPANIGDNRGVRFTYRHVRNEDDVERRGEGFGTTKGGRLYLVVYEAPTLHFFDKDVEKFRQLARSVRF